jgi:N-acetylneuraminic acid mutarotase
VAVVGHKAYVFGGEFEPRVPIDNLVHVFDLEKRTWSVAETKGQAPHPRVGVTMAAVGKVIYVFAGRDKESEELNEFFSFDTTSGAWKLLSSGDESPPHRCVCSSNLVKYLISIIVHCYRNGCLLFSRSLTATKS